MTPMELKELKRRSSLASQMLKEGKVLPEHDFSHIPEWEKIIHKVIAEMLSYRLKNGITQEELAQRMDKKQSEISRFEHIGRNPSIELLYKFAEALGLKLFVSPFGDRTVVLSTDKMEILQKYIGEENPDITSVLYHVIEDYDKTHDFEMTINSTENFEDEWYLNIQTTNKQEDSPYRIAAAST